MKPHINHPWSERPDEVIRQVNGSNQGLSESEAASRLAEHGANRIPERTRATTVELILKQIKSPLIGILLIAAAITFALHEYVNMGVLLATIFVNVALGFWQENKAEAVLEALKKYTRTHARVRRDGKEREIDAEELVVGDVVRLTAGLRVPADARVLATSGLQVDESILTGESLPENKDAAPVDAAAPVADRTSILFGGTLVVQGIVDAVVVATGADMEFGRIASLVGGEERETTPLQKAVAAFARQASFGLVVLCILLFAIGAASGRDPQEMFFIAVAVAVSAVPEGLPVALTVILASGVERLARRQGVVRKLLAAETLGSTSLILTDKTGTLTLAHMSLTDIHPMKTEDGENERLLRDAVLATDIVIENPTDEPARWRTLGKAMEESLVRDAAVRGVRLPELVNKYKFKNRIPFNSVRKYGGVTLQTKEGTKDILLGAPDVLAALCDLPEAEEHALLVKIETHTQTGARLLGVARRENGKMEFAGWLAFRDPLRPGVDEALRRITESGVKTAMVTGDHPGTAVSIAQTLGLMDGNDGVLTGIEIDQLDNTALLARLPSISVFARTTPEHKLRLVQLYQARGEVVAVTGDGVNDAPALRAADVGVAMGSGTDAAKAASDLIILDDNFSTIVAAVEEGRRILDNIRKALSYLLSNAFGELVLIGGSIIFGFPLPLTAIQILYVNFFSDSFPAVAYAFEHIADSDRRQPRYAGQLLDRRARFIVFVIGLISSISLFVIYATLLNAGFERILVHSFVFMAFGTYTLFVSLSLRSLRKPLWTYGPFGNKPLAVGVLIGLGLMIGAIYLPWLNGVLGTVPLAWPWVLGVIGFGAANIGLVEITKHMFRKMD